MLQQDIFGDRNYKQKLANFNIDGISDLAGKKKIIEEYNRALESGRIEKTKEEAIQADFLNKFFGDILYRERLEFEQIISKQFYSQYKAMRIELFEHLKQDNPGIDQFLLITKTQKLLDRFIFVCFCEDANLLPSDTLKKTKNILTNAFDFEPNKLWRQLKGLFHSIDTGNPPLDITKFNGGLFAKDDELDTLIIKDDILLKLIDFSDFDFASDLNVNILGHIFEQSLSDIEEIKAQIGNGKELSINEKFDIRKNGKRKKEGIFYTPEYITRYIVKEAIGGWLDDRKRELGFYGLPELTADDLDSITHVRRKSKKDGKMYKILEYSPTIEQHIAFWKAYKERLWNIKVLDPACGSGAFLNQAFDYLYAEGQKVNEEISRLHLGQREIFELDRYILTNNIFGVDLNPESVEITKLSLWLKTAKKGKELTALDENIKCGNSLIDDAAVAGERAFDWEKEYAAIMKEGGFDVIIGNPPYVFAREKINETEKNYYVQKYSTAHYQVNTYILFIERAFNLLKDKGYFGFIVPNAWLMVSSAKNLREMLLNKSRICEIINLAGYSFEGVNVETNILNAKKEKVVSNALNVKLSSKYDFVFSHTRNQEEFLKNDGFEFKVFSDDSSDRIYEKITKNSIILDEVTTIKSGLKAYQAGKGNPKQNPGDVKSRPFDFKYKFDENTHKYIEGKNVSRYHISWSGDYLKFGAHLAEPRIFHGPKIIVREITSHFPNSIIASYTDELLLFNISNIAIVEKNGPRLSLKYILGILNSRLMSYYFMKYTPKAVRKMFPKIILKDLRQFPIRIAENQQPFIEKVDFMLAESNRLHQTIDRFIQLLQSKRPNLKITGRISEWYKLSFDDFRKELEKQKIKLSLQEQAEWLQYFNEQKQEAEIIQSSIAKTDNEIDKMVYELYELTDEEIRIVVEHSPLIGSPSMGPGGNSS